MRIILLLSLLIIENAAEDLDEGWVAVQHDEYIDFNLEQYSLEIKTDSTLGSEDIAWVMFYTSQEDLAGGLLLYFTSTPKYHIMYCSSDRTNFLTDLPTARDKVYVWRVTLTRTSGIRLVVHCNEVEVINTLMSDSTCSDSDWSIYLSRSRSIAKIKFHYSETASDFYRPLTVICTGLKAEWTSTIKTAANFPVDPGTVVEVTCSDPEALNKGSNEVTCTIGTEFTFSKEPCCFNLGKS
ncbi:uncharacterized protein LOC134824828 [Bolinopsis microptera]|uniref:uncharacterized protein LOC134824828 n=1 Tax=Bolinopsis microptera TaxID=2820187 RepID=UPI0030797C7D